MVGAPEAGLHTLVRHRGLIWAFSVRDFRTRYRSSALGWVWSLLQPLSQLTVYAVVFSIVFKVPVPPMGDGGKSYVLFLFTGLIAFNLFARLLDLSMAGLRASGDLLRKVSFPAYAPVLGASVVAVSQIGVELAVLLVWFLVVGNAGVTWIVAPVFLLGLALLSQGLGLVLASANARYGDVQFIVGVLLQALYFLTPVLYPLSAVPGDPAVVRQVVEWSPLSWFVEGLHSCLYELHWPPAWQLLGCPLLGLVVFAGGLRVFERTTEDIGELL